MWIPEFQRNATVLSQVAPRSYTVQTPTGSVRRNRRHLILLPDTTPTVNPPTVNSPLDLATNVSPEHSTPCPTTTESPTVPGATVTRSGRISTGTRWITHKLNATKKILSMFGAYTHHLAALSEDTSVKSTHPAKLTGYYTQWTHAKYILGCALFIDLLTPCSIFSKVMQYDEIDVVAALTSLLKTLREMEKLASKPLSQWDTYSTTCAKFVKEGSGSEDTSEYYYQAQKVKYYRIADQYFVGHYKDYCKGVSQCIKSCLEWFHLELMRDIIVVLNTLGWEKLLEENNPVDEILRLVTRFKVPLEGAEASTEKIYCEFTEMMGFCRTFYFSFNS